MDTKKRREKDRCDQVLVARGLVQTRDAAVRMILAGKVRRDGAVVDKPSRVIPVDARIEMDEDRPAFVSRGGEKLSAALDVSALALEGRVCLDVGCSTGGFTDCLLQRGAAKVYAVDVGYGQFDWRLRQDPRVVLIERTNIRYMARSAIPEPIDLVVIDVSFISLTKVLQPVLQFLQSHAHLIALIKPQFEVGKGQVGRGGVVRDEGQRARVVQQVLQCAADLGLQSNRVITSPIKGKKKGNEEILAILEYRAPFHGM
ncbi:MAG: TlyA family rRNA (cytidine-2'-O)-methyltransferase [Nitrospira sp. WS238]|nr:TlyA family rRNA (cytidine-2'-O)-methyltransferase [Nitrospira sp. WS238]